MNTHGHEHSPAANEEARPRIADCCGAQHTGVTPVKHYGRDLLCEPHFLERRSEFAKEEEVARALAPLLEHRYKTAPEELIRIVQDFITLRDDVVLEMLRGATWEQILRADEREYVVDAPSWLDAPQDDAATS